MPSGEPRTAQLLELEDTGDPLGLTPSLDRLEEAHPGITDMLAASDSLRHSVIAVCGASRSLTRLLISDPSAVEVLGDLDRRKGLDETEPTESALKRWKDLEYLRVAARDLLGLDELEAVVANLSQLARDVLTMSSRLANATHLSIIGMGKLGGNELNYASDIDIMFVSGSETDPVRDETAAREVMRIAGQCFRVDANLRPEGRNGALTRSLSSYVNYWHQWAEPWEFQALLKARPACGPTELEEAFLNAVDANLWDRCFTADELRSLRSMKARTEIEVARSKSAGRDLKRGPGGIRDIEFSIQLLQLVHGRHDHHLRTPATLDALIELRDASYIDDGDAFVLGSCYRFLRTVEHRLQLVDEQQTHSVPKIDAERDRLARVLGYKPSHESSVLNSFDADLVSRQAMVRSVYERVYFRPLLEAFSGSSSKLSRNAAEERLAAFGFRETERTRQAVRELTRGLARSSRLMDQYLPLLLGWLADSPDPDQGLLGLRTLASGTQQSMEMVRSFRESPEVARRLCLILGTSRLLGRSIEHNPDLIADLAGHDPMTPTSVEQLVETTSSALKWREPDDRTLALRRCAEREVLRIATRDLLGHSDLSDTETGLTRLAQAALKTALEACEPQIPFSIVALGRFGGAELSYASDLDVLFVYEGSNNADIEEAERISTALVRFVGGDTPVERIWALDLNLRPEGRQGPLARSIEGFDSYFQRWAAVWERQALARARPVAGDQDLSDQFMTLVDRYVWQPPLTDEHVREIRRIKARVERERLPAGDDPQFHLKLGRGALVDIEFCVQLLQLQHSVSEPGTVQALSLLSHAGHISDSDAALLLEAYVLCEETRNRLYLVRGTPDDALPRGRELLTSLARSLETTPSELREHYRRVTRRAREVVERLFYGRSTNSAMLS